MTTTQYIKEERPYSVYAFIWDDENVAVAQRIGTMVFVKETGDEPKITTEPVYRLADKENMLDFRHCFMGKDEANGGKGVDAVFLGYENGTVGKEQLVKIMKLDAAAYASSNVSYYIKLMKACGLKWELGSVPEEITLEASVKEYRREKETRMFRVLSDKEFFLSVAINGKPVDNISSLAYYLLSYKEIGVNITMLHVEEPWQKAVDEMMSIALEFMKFNEKCGETGSFYKSLYSVATIRKAVGRNSCTVRDLEKTWHEEYYTKEFPAFLIWATENELLKVSGEQGEEKITFCELVERICNWRFKMPDNEVSAE